MRQTLRLLRQLNEAQKYILRNDINTKRIAIILLDNFVEIQLYELVSNRFSWSNYLYSSYKRIDAEYPYKHYTKKEQEKALKYHDSLLKVALNEGFIDDEDINELTFAHEVRNKAYHRFEEEKTLTRVGIYLLYCVICKRQKIWGGGKSFTTYSSNDLLDNEYTYFNIKNTIIGFSWEQYWPSFYQDFFRVEELETFDASKAISDFVLNILDETNDSIDFIQDFMKDDFNFNELLSEYYFWKMIEQQFEENRIANDDRNDLIISLRNDFKKKFRKQRSNKIEILIERATELAFLSINEVLLKYNNLMTEVNYFNEAFCSIHSDIEDHIQNEIDRFRGK